MPATGSSSSSRSCSTDEVAAARDHFASSFAHTWETGLRPDEVNYDPASTPPELTRQLCNVWKADRTLAATVLAKRNAEFGAMLAGAPGLRLIQDNAIWKPPSGKALLCHQDAAYVGWLEPTEHDDLLDGARRHQRRRRDDLLRARLEPLAALPGRRLVPRARRLAGVRQGGRAGRRGDRARPDRGAAGGAAFHDGWTFHGSPPNERADRERRAIVSHMVSTDTRWAEDATPHPVYSKYRRPGERELDEAFFPILWREDGHRTPWLDAWCVRAAAPA